jgi:hypothetical protein
VNVTRTENDKGDIEEERDARNKGEWLACVDVLYDIYIYICIHTHTHTHTHKHKKVS